MPSQPPSEARMPPWAAHRAVSTPSPLAAGDLLALLQLTPQFIWVTDPGGEVAWYNDWGLAYTGLTQEQVRRDGWLSAVEASHRERVLEVWRAALKGGSGHYEVEMPLRRASDGTIRWHLVRGVLVRDAENGEPVRWVGNAVDIHDRREAQAALAARLAELEAVYRSAPVGLAIIDRDLRFTRINEHLAEINGASVEAHLGRTVREMVPDLTDQAETVLRRVIETGEPLMGVRIEGETPARPGARRAWIEHFLPVRDATGAVLGMSVVAEEVTEREAAERERERLAATLAERGDRLREADRRKDEFLAMLGHELRNPLAPVLNGLRLLERRETLSEPGRQALSMMDRQVHHMKRLVDDLLEVSRITRGKIELRPESMLLDIAVLGAVETVLPAADARRQTIEVALPGRPIRMVADPVRVAQMLENLLTNASKYTPEGGAIRVEAREEGEDVELRIVDDGIGIEPAQLESVFDLFAQGEAGQARSQGGLGIGLALVRQLAGLHGGRVHAESAGRGRGATFVLRLPRRPPAG